MTELVGSPDIRPEIAQVLRMADRVIAGGPNVDLNTPEGHETLDPSEVFVGPLYDLNDPETNPQEEAVILDWIESKLGGQLPDIPVKSSLRSGDGTTTVKIFDKPLGEEGDKWFISQWQGEGEGQRPYYVFRQEEMYDNLEFEGYEAIEPSE